MRPRVFAYSGLAGRAQDELERSFELLEGPAGADGLLTTPAQPVDGALLDAAGPQLRVVAQHAVGLDNVDLAAADERGVLVANTPGVLTRATAELTMALLLALARRVPEGDRLLRAGGTWVWTPTFMLGFGLDGKTLGVVGRGRIGGEVARLAEAFGMRVVESSRTHGIPLAELLAQADVVTLHCPLTDETRGLIDAAALARMKPTAVLVNTARGPLVDEAALVEALREGRIAGAALDVFEREPEVHPGLLGLDNVVLAPHVGSATLETREAMGMLCVEALRAVLLEDRVPANAVSR